MAKLSGGVDYFRVVRFVGAGAIVSLAFFFASLDPFLRAAPMTGTAVSDRTAPVSVNRDRKGDRLPLFRSSDNSGRTGTNHTILWDVRGLNGSQARERVPVGCDPAFSPVASPSLATVYGRCTT
jgi:hypothetical protein